MTVIVIGKNSLMGAELHKKRGSDTDWLFLSHTEALADTSWVDQASCLINLSFSPVLRTHDYDKNEDIDLKLAELISSSPSHYIMISSRTVYGRSSTLRRFRERDTPDPQTPYAKNKLKIEENLFSLLENRLTVLRGSNVFGHEYGRKSFFGMALQSLKDRGQIVFDMNPDVRRDFLAAWRVADALISVSAAPQHGIFNLGSGYGTRCGDIASWIIEGYGRGSIVSTSDEMRDDFYLDMEKTKAVFSLPDITPAVMRNDCQTCGAAIAGRSP